MYELPKLPYPYDALEPYVDALTMEIHHTKHHQTYITKLNDVLKAHPELQEKRLDELLMLLEDLPEGIKAPIGNNAGGHYNHTLFWQMMDPKGGGEPDGKLGKMIKQEFDGFQNFKINFTQAALNRFGSGWAWLVVNPRGVLEIISTPNQGSPLKDGNIPILTLDVWEHAYYLKYQNRRQEYIDNWWNVVNWEFANSLLTA